ncbi:MAG: SRPBCC domain-containing protein [Armatimonadota bacterium]
MATITENEIRCEMMLKASVDKVWNALTTAEGWTGWFSYGVVGNFAEGELLTLDFGPYGECFALVSTVNPKTEFAYEWHPGEDCPIDKYPASEMTTVRFTLEPVAVGTKLTMVESGFASLPEARRASAFEANTGGWDSELPKITKLVENDERQLAPVFDIYRERYILAPIRKVWDAIATVEGLCSWFVSSIDGDLNVGSMAMFNFKKGCSGPVKVIERDEPNTLAWKWHPGEVDGCTWDKYPESELTTVQFTLKETDAGVQLVVKESGFANIPEGRRLTALGLNKGGWTWCMDTIKATVLAGL